MKSFKLHFTEAIVRRAIKAFWWRSTGWSYFIAMAFIVGFLIYLVAIGDRSWRVGAGAVVVGLGLAMAVLLYVVHFRGSINRFRRMKVPEVTFEAGDDRFRMISDIGTIEAAWSAIVELWQFPDFWLIFYSRSQFNTLPMEGVDSAGREFILDRVREHGAKVR